MLLRYRPIAKVEMTAFTPFTKHRARHFRFGNAEFKRDIAELLGFAHKERALGRKDDYRDIICLGDSLRLRQGDESDLCIFAARMGGALQTVGREAIFLL